MFLQGLSRTLGGHRIALAVIGACLTLPVTAPTAKAEGLPISLKMLLQDTAPPSELDDLVEIDPFFLPNRSPYQGLYFRGSGMYVDPQEDGRITDGSGTVETDDGFGLSLALGYKDPGRPLSIEFEYAYRRFDTEDYIDPATSLLGDNRISLHTLTFNVLYDQPNLIGPVGVYAGIGLGVRIQEFRYSNSGDDEHDGSTTEIHGSGFFWQAMAGVTVSIGPRSQLYGGIRWADAGELDDDEDSLRLDAEMINIEFGFRFFF